MNIGVIRPRSSLISRPQSAYDLRSTWNIDQDLKSTNPEDITENDNTNKDIDDRKGSVDSIRSGQSDNSSTRLSRYNSAGSDRSGRFNSASSNRSGRFNSAGSDRSGLFNNAGSERSSRFNSAGSDRSGRFNSAGSDRSGRYDSADRLGRFHSVSSSISSVTDAPIAGRIFKEIHSHLDL